MIRYFAALLLASLTLSTQATELNSNQYDVYYGDINNDGHVDIYLKGKSIFVPINGDIMVPLILAPTPSMVLYRKVIPAPSCTPDIYNNNTCPSAQLTDDYTGTEFLELAESVASTLILAEEDSEDCLKARMIEIQE